jgi:hypothetical protein
MPLCKPVFIEGTTLGDTWFQLLQACYDHGRKYLISDGSYAGAYRLAFDDVSGFIHYPHEKPLAPIMPEASSLPAPTTDHDIEMYFADYLMNNQIQDNEDYKYATFITGGKYNVPQNVYGESFISSLPIGLKNISVPNQLEWVIKHFKEKGFGNEHCYITVGYPESNFAYDIPFLNEQERKTSPCLRGLDFRIITEVKYICPECEATLKLEETFTTNGRNILCPYDRQLLHYLEPIKDNYLLTKVIYRSWDLWGGWPTNMGGFALLSQYIANELGIIPGPLSFTCKSLHCYDFQLEILKMRLNK